MLVISVAAMVQFAVFTWRAGLLRVAAEALPGEAAGADDNLLNQNDFQDALRHSGDMSFIISIFCVKPEAYTPLPQLPCGREHPRLLPGPDLVGLAGLDPNARWHSATRYSNVVLSRRLQQNQRAAAMMRSF